MLKDAVSATGLLGVKVRDIVQSLPAGTGFPTHVFVVIGRKSALFVPVTSAVKVSGSFPLFVTTTDFAALFG
jgi:hypothetical protein